MKGIKDYINFAINNEYKLEGLSSSHKNDIKRYIKIVNCVKLDGELDLGINFDNKINGLYIHDQHFNVYYNIIETITSIKFIEAIARGLKKAYIPKHEDIKVGEQYKIGKYDIFKAESQKDIDRMFYFEWSFEKYLIKEQAIQISLDNMEGFINNILPN